MIKLESVSEGTTNAKGFSFSDLDPPLLVICEEDLDTLSDSSPSSLLPLAVTVPGRSVLSSVLLFDVTETGAGQVSMGGCVTDMIVQQNLFFDRIVAILL